MPLHDCAVVQGLSCKQIDGPHGHANASICGCRHLDCQRATLHAELPDVLSCCVQPIAVEVDGPYHFTCNTLQPLGHTLLRCVTMLPINIMITTRRLTALAASV